MSVVSDFAFRKKFGWMMMMILTPVRALCLTLLVFSLAGYFGRGHRLLELTSHFKLQCVLAALICLLLFLILRESSLWLVCALLALALNAAAIVPRYIPRPSQHSSATPPPKHFKLLLSNVNYGNDHYKALTNLVEQESPDVIVCQEVTKAWDQELKTLHARYPFNVSVPLPKGSGIALLSRLPLTEAQVLDLGVSGRPGILAEVEIEGKMVSLLALHPPTPLRADDFAARNRQLLEAARALRLKAGPKILIGDLNTSLWSPYASDLRSQTGLIDARSGRGILPSWPTWLPPFLRIPIDQCLVSPNLFVTEIKTGPQIGSDHLPLIVEVGIASPDGSP